MRKKTGVRTQIIVPAMIASITAIFLIAVILIVSLSISLNSEINTQQEKILSENENRIHAFMSGPEEAAMTAAVFYGNLTTSDVSREGIINALQDFILSNPKYLAVWLAYEPDEFDGSDSSYIGFEDLGSNKDGRFTPCVVLDNGSPVVSSMEVDGEDFYEAAKAGRNLHITSPFSYDYGTKIVTVISICMPVIIDNHVVAVCGVDISLEEIVNTITDYKLYKTGKVRLMYGDGSYVAHEIDSYLNTVSNSNAAKKAMQQTGIFKEKAKGKQNVYSQIKSDKSDAIWIIELEIPLREAKQAIYIAIVIAVVAIIVSICGILFVMLKIGNNIERTIVEPIKHLSKVARRMSLGELDITLDTGGDDEIADLTHAFQSMIEDTYIQAEHLKRTSDGDLDITVKPRSDKDVLGNSIVRMLDKLNYIFGFMNTASSQLNSASLQIAEGSQSLAEGAMSQAMAIEKLRVTLNELSTNTIHNADEASQATILSASVLSSAKEGHRQMDHMIEAVNEITEANHGINQVMEVIDNIAFQTNLLALNASIEAARAGEMGKGFSVVAKEVQNLALQSQEAAKKTRGLILNSIKKAELGAKISSDTAASFSEIVNGISKTNGIVEKMSTFITEQKDDILTISNEVNEISAVVQSVSATAEESASASEEMSAQAELMTESIAEFKLRS